jgi:hypothetical protein
VTWTPWKTYEQHLDYMHRMVRLCLWFLWNWQQRRPEETFSSILRRRTLIYRYSEIHTDFFHRPRGLYDDPRWQENEAGLAQLMKRRRGDPDASAFENEGLELLRETIRLRSIIDYDEEPQCRRFAFGSLRYNTPDTTERPLRIVFHISNGAAPKSIFDDPAYLPHAFLDMMADARAKYGAEELSTNTWLNDVPKWQGLFPSEYVEHMGPADPEIRAHLGYWGQFVDARGLFNEHRGERFRRTGRMQYGLRYSWCRFDRMEAHLRWILQERGV